MGYIILVVFIMYGIIHHQINHFVVTKYSYDDKKIPNAFNGYKIVHLSDLHSKQFGRDNNRFIHQIKEIKPDLLIVTGDMVNSTDKKGDVFLEIARQLVHTCEIYYVEGNHELSAKFDTENLNTGWYDTYINQLERMGVKLLNNEIVKVFQGHSYISLVGVTVPLTHYSAVPPQIKKHHPDEVGTIFQQIGSVKQDGFSILLAHSPLLVSEFELFGADLIFSGHMHGGIIRIPFVGGLLSPERTFFPKMSGGYYLLKNSTLVVSRGLGNSSVNVRLFNQPEIVVMTLTNQA